jgi:hypothetical protein
MDNRTPGFTEKEVRELYEGLSKKQLVSILISHWRAAKVRDDQAPWNKNNPTILIGM